MDVVDLKDFYSRPLGKAARRLIARRIRACAPERGGLRTMGLGYAVPYLDPWLGETGNAFGFMPARQGVVRWPAKGPGSVCLVDEAELPLEDGSIDLALVVHGLEFAENPHAMLRELWRVMSPQGRCVFVAPNRSGLWARFDGTPFGHGRPFSRSQLTRLLRDAMFIPGAWTHALFVPPIDRGFFVRLAPALERMGQMSGPIGSGVIVAEAQKRVFADIGGERRRSPIREPVPTGAVTASVSTTETRRARP